MKAPKIANKKDDTQTGKGAVEHHPEDIAVDPQRHYTFDEYAARIGVTRRQLKDWHSKVLSAYRAEAPVARAGRFMTEAQFALFLDLHLRLEREKVEQRKQFKAKISLEKNQKDTSGNVQSLDTGCFPEKLRAANGGKR